AIVTALMVKLGFWLNAARISDLKFPVVVVQSDGSPPFVETESGGLKRIRIGSGRIPVNGSIVIDSDFKMYTQENVKCTEGVVALLQGPPAVVESPLPATVPRDPDDNGRVDQH